METHRVCDSEERARDTLTEDSLLSDGKDNESATTKPRSQKSFYIGWVQDWWLVELASLALGNGATIAIVSILLYYQDKPAPHLNSVIGVGISLNTIVAILAAVSRASVLLAVAECISQQKWVWFSGSARPLTELDVFDQGSRGAFGSLVLMWKVKLRNIVSIGALLLVLGLAVDPMSQALLSYETRPQVDTESAAYVDTAYMWDSRSQEDNLLDTADSSVFQAQDPPLYMKAAVLTGLFASNATINHTPPVCASGNCNWSPYHSLAVCTRWQDVSSHVKHVEVYEERKNTTYSLWSLTDRNFLELGLEFSTCQLNMSSAANPEPDAGYAGQPSAMRFDDSIAFKDSNRPLADVFIVYKNASDANETDGDYSGGHISALEIVLEWCVQEFNTSVVNGTVVTTRLNSTNAFEKIESGFIGRPLTNPNANVSWPAGTDRYYVPDLVHYSLANHLRKVFNGFVFRENMYTYRTSDVAEVFWSIIRPGAFPDTRPTEKEIQAGISHLLQNVATSITNVVRNPRYYSGTTGEVEPWFAHTFMQANGTAWRERTFVQVRWGWIAAPVTLVLLSIIFVAVTIVQSSGQAKTYMIWKSSLAPTLLALSEELHRQVGGLRSLSENERALKYAKASLRRNEESEWRLHGSLDR
ncbi:hypothetical protein K458DRAFT_436675 [Lentithecium fluviatile CBS 122367]|uniref:Uncharacterized protein n=1 Tax=Lentithecium fluviatile CBS 122367 TaxID=1168545 RepID=A0A6G1IGN1_9PLEO|nr:hypothetical protein K458DRAFT_436675 [Lentithecium fluviatile CBS 122367]